MRRVALLLLLVVAVSAGCVSVAPLPDPRGALKPGQRLVVNVYPSPGPWIIDGADSKAVAAAKLSPLGFLVQSTQDERTLSVSKNLQQYLPRPRLALQFQDSLLKSLKIVRSSSPVQTGLEAGIVGAQLLEWNKAKDQLDWRQRYYAPDPDQPAPRDYARILTLDDALILDVNVSFGTDANDDGHLLPQMTAATRAYRGDTSRLLWEHEDIVSETTSSATLSDYQMQPWTLTDSLQKLAPVLGTTVSASFAKAFGVALSTSSFARAPGTAPSGGLVPMSFFQNMNSTAATAGVAFSTTAAAIVSTSTATLAGIAPSSSTVSGLLLSTATAAAAGVPAISSATAAPAMPALPGLSPGAAAPASISTPTVSISTSPP